MYRILTVFRIYEAIISVLETHRRSLDMNAISRAVSWLSQARQILHWELAAVPLSVHRRFSTVYSVWGYQWSVRMMP